MCVPCAVVLEHACSRVRRSGSMCTLHELRPEKRVLHVNSHNVVDGGKRAPGEGHDENNGVPAQPDHTSSMRVIYKTVRRASLHCFVHRGSL